jgi:hypothetical protein
VGNGLEEVIVIMTEILYAGTISRDKMPLLVTACHFEPEARFLAEHIPNRFIETAQARRELLRFMYVKDGTPCAAYVTGRIFQEDRELRWEQHKEAFRVVYLGPTDSTDENIFYEYGLKNKGKELEALKKSSEPTYYYLFGERLKTEDLPYFGKTAQPGDFAVVRIPRVLRYPVPQDDKPSVRLLVREYHNAVTGNVDLFRFQGLETWNDKKGGGARV